MTSERKTRLEKAVEDHRETLEKIADSDVDLQLVEDVNRLLYEVDTGRKTTGPVDGFVYIAEAEPGMVKVGKSKHPQKRLKQLSTGSPQELELLCSKEVSDAREKEVRIQRQFSEYKKRGEWYSVDGDTKEEMIDAVESLPKHT